jgi:hypothetical protein
MPHQLHPGRFQHFNAVVGPCWECESFDTDAMTSASIEPKVCCDCRAKTQYFATCVQCGRGVGWTVLTEVLWYSPAVKLLDATRRRQATIHDWKEFCTDHCEMAFAKASESQRQALDRAARRSDQRRRNITQWSLSMSHFER